MKKFLYLFALLIFVPLAQAQTTVSGHLTTLGGTAVTSNAFVRFRLRNYSGNIPRLTGTGVCSAAAVLPLRGGGAIFYDLTPNASGVISGTICGNDVISPANTFYSVELWAGGTTPTQQNFIISGGTFNLDSAAPLQTAPTFPPLPPGTLSLGVTGDCAVYTSSTSLGDCGRPAALEPKASDAIQYVSPNGNDANDGLSMGTAKLTIAAACAAIPGGNSSCSAGTGTIYILQAYAGLEAATLVTSNLGYRYIRGNPGLYFVDYRYNPATPGNPGGTPLYPISFAGRSLGQLARFAVTSGYVSPNDSTSVAAFFNFVSGAMPSNGGTQAGLEVGIATDGTNFTDANGSAIVGAESYVSIGAIGTPNTLPAVYGMHSSINLDRAGVTQSATIASAFHAGAGQNISSSGGTVTNAYGFDGMAQTIGTARNYSFHSQGNTLFENNTGIDTVDGGGTTHRVVTFSGGSAGLQLSLSTKSSPYTLTASDSWVNVTGTTTITVPHALTGQRWHVKNTGTAIVTLVPDSGNLDGLSGAPWLPLLPQNSTELTCDGTNCQTGLTFPYTIGEVNLTGRTANLGPTTIGLGIPAGGGGMYRASCYVVETTNAGTSSTLPQCNILFTDSDSSVAENFQLTGTNAGNTVGSTGLSGSFVGSAVFNAQAATNIQYQTSGYASNPATTMQYAIHIRLEYLGP